MRSAVDREHQRVLLRRVEARRLDDPPLDLQAVRRRVPDVLHLAQFDARQDVAVHVGDLPDVPARSHIEDNDIAWLVRAGDHAGRHAVRGHGIHGQVVLAPGDLPHRPVERGEVQVLRTAVGSVVVDAAAVRRPPQAGGIAVAVRGDLARAAPVGIHHVDVVGVVRVVGLVVAQIRHQPAVRRRHGRVVGPRARGQLPDVPRRHRHRIDLGLAEAVVGIGLAQAAEQDLRAVGGPHRSPVVPVAAGQLAGRAAGRGQHEDVPVPPVGVAHVVAPVVGPRDHLGLHRPLRALRPTGDRDGPLGFRRDHHRKGQRPAVRRPRQATGRLGEMADLGLGPLRVHPAHEDLGGAIPVRAHERDPLAVRRPHRTATVGQPPGPRAVGIHDVQLRHPAVLHPVDVPALVQDLAAVGRDLRPHPAREQERPHLFPVEVEFGRETAGLLLGGVGLGG